MSKIKIYARYNLDGTLDRTYFELDLIKMYGEDGLKEIKKVCYRQRTKYDNSGWSFIDKNWCPPEKKVAYYIQTNDKGEIVNTFTRDEMGPFTYKGVKESIKTGTKYCNCHWRKEYR